MANSRSARKQIRAAARKHERNKAVRASVRTYVGKARKVLLEPAGTEGVETTVHAAIRALDRAAEKGIIHRNNANRRKSRLASMAARIAAASGDDQAAARQTAAGAKKGTAKRAVGKKVPASKAKAVTAAKAAKPAAAKPKAAPKNTARKTSATKASTESAPEA